MAKIAKSKDTKNWRKGNLVQVGDEIAVRWNGMQVAETSAVVSIGTSLYMSKRGFVFTLANGDTKHCASNEYAEGRYPGATA